jgi:hypothetical protein
VGRLLPILGLLALAACTGNVAVDAQRNSAAVAQACAVALPYASAALAIPTVGPFVAAGVQVGCMTNAGLAKLAADPSSVAWLNQQTAMLKQALGRG